MSKFVFSLAAAGALSFVVNVTAAPAEAAAVSFVSSKGVNSGSCSSSASPCLTFQYALNQTLAGGEIKALDPGNYGPLTINKSITITGVEGAGIIRTNAGDAVTINAGANDFVNMTGLTLDGFKKTASNGIRLNTTGQLTIKNCVVQNFSIAGIVLNSTGKTNFLIEDAIVSNNDVIGIGLSAPATSASNEGVINRVTIKFNKTIGIAVGFHSAATVTNSVAANNGIGIDAAGATGLLRLAHSVVTGNSVTGVKIFDDAPPAQSAGDNFIRGNACTILICKDVEGTLINVGTR